MYNVHKDFKRDVSNSRNTRKKQASLVVPANGIGMQPETPFLHDVGVSNEGHLTVRQVASGGKRVSFTDTHTSRCFPFTDTHTKRVRFGKMDFIPPFGHNFGTRSVDVNSDTKLPDRITNNDNELLQAAARILQYVDANMNSDTKLTDVNPNDIELPPATSIRHNVGDPINDVQLAVRHVASEGKRVRFAESYTKRVRFGGVELIPLSGQNFDTSSVDIKSKRNIT